MEFMRPDQLLILLVFMGALGGLWLYVQRHKAGLSAKLHRGRRLHLCESVLLGAQTRATLLQVDGQDYLLVHGKTGTPALHALHNAPAQGEQNS
ncbi:MAG: flagellar biosynthetic protein FliO [Roseinatronobacter sp.]